MGINGSKKRNLPNIIKFINPPGIMESQYPMNALCTTQEGRILASAFARLILIWDTEMSLCVCVLQGHEEIVTDLRFSFDSSILVSCGADSSIRIWQKQLGKWICTNNMTDIHGGWAWSCRWILNSKLASVGTDGQLVIWDASSNPRSVYRGVLHTKSASCIAVMYTPSQTFIVTAGNDSVIVVSSVSNTYEEDLTVIKRIAAHLGSVIGIDSYNFNNNGGTVFVTIGEDKTVRHWSMLDVIDMRSSISPSVPHVSFSNQSNLTCVKYSIDGRFVAVSDRSGCVTIYRSEIPSLKILPSIIEKRKFQLGSIQSMAWTRNNHGLLLGLENASIVKVDLGPNYWTNA